MRKRLNAAPKPLNLGVIPSPTVLQISFKKIMKESFCLVCFIVLMLSIVFFSYMRMDSLSQILSLSNVKANGRFMVMESCVGLLAGACLERMGGTILSYLY